MTWAIKCISPPSSLIETWRLCLRNPQMKLIVKNYCLVANWRQKRACTFPILPSTKSWRQLPEPNSIFLHEITSKMVKSNHKKLKKNLSRILHTLYQFRRALWSPSEKATFWKNAIANFFNIFLKNWGHTYAFCWLPNLQNC